MRSAAHGSIGNKRLFKETKPRFLSNRDSEQSSSSCSSDFLDNLGDLLDKQLMVSTSSAAEVERSRRVIDNKPATIHSDSNVKEKHDDDDDDDDDDGWRIIDWKDQFWNHQYPQIMTKEKVSSPSSSSSSPVERVLVRNRLVYFKRDDQLRLSAGAPISGNKARKMISLNDIPSDDEDSNNNNNFPSCVVSFGGPQSNAMLALAAIVHFKNQEALSAVSAVSSSSSSTTKDTDTTTATTNDNNNNIASSDHSTDDANDDSNESTPSAPPPPPIKRFVYYTKKLPKFLKSQPSGNLFRAQTLGMELKELSTQEYRNLFGGEYGGPAEPPLIDPPVRGDSLWVPQGGACGMALRGAWELAFEIVDYWSHEGKGRPLTVCIPGGTCSTAALVNAALYEIQKQQQSTRGKDLLDIQVVVIPCVGDEQYAQRQMTSLLKSTWKKEEQGCCSNDDDVFLPPLPTILKPIPDDTPRYFGQSSTDLTLGASYFQFAEPHEDILATFREMQEEYGISLDLIYGAPSWTILLRHFRAERIREETAAAKGAAGKSTATATGTFDPNAPLAGREIMYVHSGGLEGVNSQLMRYKYKGYIEDVQLPGRRR